MYTATTKLGLLGFIKNKEMRQRQDSVTDQAFDMLAVFESFGLFGMSAHLCRQFNVIEGSTRYKDITDQVVVNVELEETPSEGKQNAIALANLFGCYDLADALK